MVRSLEEFDFALNTIWKEKGYGEPGRSLLGLLASRIPDEDNKMYNELKQEFCKRYDFTEELFEIALEGWSSWIDVKDVNEILRDPKYKGQKMEKFIQKEKDFRGVKNEKFQKIRTNSLASN